MNNILQEIRNIYDNKIIDLDKEIQSDETDKMKLSIFGEYIKELHEQNLILVETAEELEKEAAMRVETIEKLLLKTTVSTKEYMGKLHCYFEDLRKIWQEKLEMEALAQTLQAKCDELEEEKNSLQDQNVALSQNVSALLQLMNKSRISGIDLANIHLNELNDDCVASLDEFSLRSFDNNTSSKEFTISSEDMYKSHMNSYIQNLGNHCLPDVFGAKDYSSSPITEKDVMIKRLQIDLKCSQQSNEDIQFQLLNKDQSIAALQTQNTELQHELSLKDHECISHMQTIHLIQDQHRFKCLENSRNEALIKELKDELQLLKENNTDAYIAKYTDAHNISRELGIKDKAKKSCVNHNIPSSDESVPNGDNFMQYQNNLLSEQIISLNNSITHLQSSLNEKNNTVKALQKELDAYNMKKVNINCISTQSQTEFRTNLRIKPAFSDCCTQTENLSTYNENVFNYSDIQVANKTLEVSCQKEGMQIDHSERDLTKVNHYIKTNEQNEKTDIEKTLSGLNQEILKKMLHQKKYCCKSFLKNLNIEESTKGNDDKNNLLCSHCRIKDDVSTEGSEVQMTGSEKKTLMEELSRLKMIISILEATNQETREILTQEIVEKHDIIMSMKQDMMEQSCQHKEVVQQLVLKNEVIKELRKEGKQANEKIKEQNNEIQKLQENLIIVQEQSEKQTVEIENQKTTIFHLQEVLMQARKDVPQTKKFPSGETSATSKIKSVSGVFDI